jgi:hypothetical protein
VAVSKHGEEQARAFRNVIPRSSVLFWSNLSSPFSSTQKPGAALFFEMSVFVRLHGVTSQNGFRGLGVCMLASVTQDRGFAPDRSRLIFWGEKIHSMPSFGWEVK